MHGANRLASNSLLEGMVFGPRVIEAIVAGVDAPEATGAMRTVLGDDAGRGRRAGRSPGLRQAVPPARSRARCRVVIPTPPCGASCSAP